MSRSYAPTRYEQETVITFNEAEAAASVYTHNRKLRRKLLQVAEQQPNKVIVLKQDERSAEFLIPKSCISVRVPYSEERRKADSQRERAAHMRPPNRRGTVKK